MSLNIKNDEANTLAHKLATLPGESLTTAVTISLRERPESFRRNYLEAAIVIDASRDPIAIVASTIC